MKNSKNFQKIFEKILKNFQKFQKFSIFFPKNHIKIFDPPKIEKTRFLQIFEKFSKFAPLRKLQMRCKKIFQNF